jgi:hypothetical protein
MLKHSESYYEYFLSDGAIFEFSYLITLVKELKYMIINTNYVR